MGRVTTERWDVVVRPEGGFEVTVDGDLTRDPLRTLSSSAGEVLLHGEEPSERLTNDVAQALYGDLVWPVMANATYSLRVAADGSLTGEGTAQHRRSALDRSGLINCQTSRSVVATRSK